jgi:hypothetical protein
MNLWENIPISDYENHMSDLGIAQLQLLSQLMTQAYSFYKPESLAIFGICGGNGLEYIDNNITKCVYGIDVNQEYLNICNKRYNNKINNLQLLNFDLKNKDIPNFKVELIFAGLIFEYININQGLIHAYSHLKEDGHLITILQNNNNINSVSPTKYKSLELLENIFNQVNIIEFINLAIQNNFELIEKKEYFLINGKSFIYLDLKKKY